MLARRFTMVCLLAALFGLFLAALAADPGRGKRSHGAMDVLPTESPADR